MRVTDHLHLQVVQAPANAVDEGGSLGEYDRRTSGILLLLIE